MAMVVKETFITDLKSFQWDKKWVALWIAKEKKIKGDYYFAYIVRHFGINNESNDVDISTDFKDFAWLGRNVKAIGSRAFSTDPEKPGQRVYEEPVFEDRQNQVTKEKYRILVDGKVIWDYTIPVNEESTKNMKKLIGLVGIDQTTTFKIIPGNTNPIGVDEKTFFSLTVDDAIKSDLEGRKKIIPPVK